MYHVIATPTLNTNVQAIENARMPKAPQVLYSDDKIEEAATYVRDLLLIKDFDMTAVMRGHPVKVGAIYTVWIVADSQPSATMLVGMANANVKYVGPAQEMAPGPAAGTLVATRRPKAR